ncbi:hypothetical protein LXA43DRAFT_898308, partial [Ganoderma leucocontextum]
VSASLTSLVAGNATGAGWPSTSTSKYSSVLSELDFQPQLWLTENTSGALMNRVMLAPVVLAHAIVKYALTAGRGSRYGCGGATGGAVAGREMGDATCVDPTLLEDAWRVFDEREKADVVGSAADRGDPGVVMGVLGVDATVRPRGGCGIDTEDPLCECALTAEGGRGMEADEVTRVR